MFLVMFCKDLFNNVLNLALISHLGERAGQTQQRDSLLPRQPERDDDNRAFNLVDHVVASGCGLHCPRRIRGQNRGNVKLSSII